MFVRLRRAPRRTTRTRCSRCLRWFVSFVVFERAYLVLGRLSSFGVLLRFCTSRRSDSARSLVVNALSWGCSFSVVDALLVMASSSISLRSSTGCFLISAEKSDVAPVWTLVD